MATAQEIVPFASNPMNTTATAMDVDVEMALPTEIDISQRDFMIIVFDIKGAKPHINIGKMKHELNFHELLKEKDCRTNEALFKFLLETVKYGPNYWSPANEKYFDCHGIYRGKCDDYDSLHIIFFSIKRPELLIPSVIRETPSLITAFSRNFNAVSGLTGDTRSSNLYKIEMLVQEMSQSKMYDLRFKGLPFCRTPLHTYQRDTVSWALNIENTEIFIKYAEDKLIDIGSKLGMYLNYENLSDSKTDPFMKYEDVMKIRAKGGILCDDPGLGKTLQMLTVAFSNPSISTIVIVPNKDIKQIWYNQIEMHFVSEAIRGFNILILTFEEFVTFNVDELKKYQRVIVDEIHELYEVRKDDKGNIIRNEHFKTFTKLLTLNHFDYRWGITGTPFPSDNSMISLIQFLVAKPQVKQQGMAFFKMIMDGFKPLFRRHTKCEQEVAEALQLPSVNIQNVILKFSRAEQDIYNAEIAGGNGRDVQFMRELCCNILMAVSATDTNTITPTELRKLTVDRFRKSVADQQYILKEIITMCENVEKEMNKEKELNGITTRKFTEYQQRYQELQYKIKAQEEIVKRRITVLESYEMLLENITDIVSTTAPSADADMDDTAMDIDDVEKDKLCPICYGTMSETIVFYSNCRHCICRTCFERLQKTNPNKCSICRDQAEVGGIVFISNSSGQVTGTKNIELLRLINRCPEKKERFIIFTQYAKMIKSIMTLLSTHDINAKTYPEFSSSTPEEKDSTQIIVLSSTSNASGIDLSFIQNVIIIEPFENYIYGREIEKQLIGRVHRINQTKEVNVFRLIISGTIEEEMYQLS